MAKVLPSLTKLSVPSWIVLFAEARNRPLPTVPPPAARRSTLMAVYAPLRVTLLPSVILPVEPLPVASSALIESTVAVPEVLAP